uniref:Uncharacterized protein n=1 Tax=Daphnia galeata TaxID=27404 RepID=A0A8J2S1B9_9CRUS|nr:unnamed protein product [Daphnia galeata]
MTTDTKNELSLTRNGRNCLLRFQSISLCLGIPETWIECVDGQTVGQLFRKLESSPSNIRSRWYEKVVRAAPGSISIPILESSNKFRQSSPGIHQDTRVWIGSYQKLRNYYAMKVLWETPLATYV